MHYNASVFVDLKIFTSGHHATKVFKRQPAHTQCLVKADQVKMELRLCAYLTSLSCPLRTQMYYQRVLSPRNRGRNENLTSKWCACRKHSPRRLMSESIRVWLDRQLQVVLIAFFLIAKHPTKQGHPIPTSRKPANIMPPLYKRSAKSVQGQKRQQNPDLN